MTSLTPAAGHRRGRRGLGRGAARPGTGDDLLDSGRYVCTAAEVRSHCELVRP